VNPLSYKSGRVSAIRKVLIIALLFAAPAFAHDAPLGWAYGAECCSMTDCWQEKDGAILETPNGYRVITTGELIAYGDSRIKPSKDQFFHRCTVGADPKARRSICLYVPPRSL
jgi:hypothetical protein